MSRGRRAYDRVSNDDDTTVVTAAAAADAAVDAPLAADQDVESQQPLGITTPIPSEQDDDDDNGERIRVVIMDPAQNKFDVPVNPNWNVGRLKKEGVAIHKIATAQQRLIFMGRMLADETTLEDAKIVKDGVIIHLFPKPRVVLLQSRMTSHASDNNTTNDESAHTESGGAHVPQIILDPDEAQMRSQILVLGSAEILDAQNNVKLLSFLLLFITSMELLALFTIMLGVPQEPDEVPVVDDDASDEDSIHHNSGSHAHTQSAAGEIRLWRNSDYFDLALNLFGFYAAMLGIKATTDNTRRLAFRYLICTVICGIFWNVFYFYLNFQVEQTIDEEDHERTGRPLTGTSDLLVQAFFAILIPMMIWIMCCMRAHQFHSLLEEAELEAEERIQSELHMQEEGNTAAAGGDGDDDDDVEEEHVGDGRQREGTTIV